MEGEQREKWKLKDWDVWDEGEKGETPQVGRQREMEVNEMMRYVLSMKKTKFNLKKEGRLDWSATIEFNRLCCHLSGLRRGIKINWIISEVEQ